MYVSECLLPSKIHVPMFLLWVCLQDAPHAKLYGDVDTTKSQDAVITEISEQYVEEASTAEVGTRTAAAAAVTSSKQDATSVEPVQIAVGGVGGVPAATHGDFPLERFSSLGQRDGYESREASNGTGLYGYDEKVEAGTNHPSWLSFFLGGGNRKDEIHHGSLC